MNKLKFLLVPLLAASFLASCSPTKKWYEYNDWWNYCSSGKKGEQATADDIGKIVNLTVNKQVHKVRLIDIDHDVLSDDTTKKAHCTFEFSNLLSDETGHSLAMFWDVWDIVPTTYNTDFVHSEGRKTLDGEGNDKKPIRWFEIGAGVPSTKYTKSALEMLPTDLLNCLKRVNKPIALGQSYNVDNSLYQTKLFILSSTEISKVTPGYAKEEGTVYKYYANHDDEASRVKEQVKGAEGSVQRSTITDVTPQIYWNAFNHAGFHDTSAMGRGSYYWLRSPCTDISVTHCYTFDIYCDGSFDSQGIAFGTIYPVAPAFCI